MTKNDDARCGNLIRDKELNADFHEGNPIYIKLQSKKTIFLKQQMVRLESLKKATICTKKVPNFL